MRISIDDLPKTLRTLRKARKCTLCDIAEASGLSISYLSDIELGRTTPRLDTLQKLAAAYGYRFVLVLEALP